MTRNAVYKFLRGGRRQPSGSRDTQQQARLEQIPAPNEDFNQQLVGNHCFRCLSGKRSALYKQTFTLLPGRQSGLAMLFR